MTHRQAARRTKIGAALAALLLAVGCSSLPDSGSVRTVKRADGNTLPEPPYFQPPGPGAGDSREAIVRGFLTAMEANPVNIRAARTFLSAGAGDAWRPTAQTLVYQAAAIEVRDDEVTVRLNGVSRLTAQGTWLPGRVAKRELHLGLVREKGEWRIDTPPNALIVGAAFFRSTFAPYSVYFYDNTGQVLVPRVVHLPRGEQTASNLVRALLSGPDALIRPVASSAFPRSTELDLAVTVNRNGTAEVPVSPNVLNMAPREVSRAIMQLTWTLRPIPGIDRVEITVDGVPVTLDDGRTGQPVDEGQDLASYGSRTSRLPVAVRNGRVVVVDNDEVTATDGPLGRRGFALRSVAQSRDAADLVAISEDGTKAYAAAMTGVDDAVQIATGADFGRPVIDGHGLVWLLDRTSSGARVLVRDGQRTRALTLPGVTGRNVRALAVSPDGVRVAALINSGPSPSVVLVNLVRGPQGAITRVLPARTIAVADAATVTDVGPGVDVAWREDATLAVLSSPTEGSSRLTFLLVDGSPSQSIDQPDDLNVSGAMLLVGARPDVAMGVLATDGLLHMLDAAGKWSEPGKEKYSGIAYPG
ncbi:MAG: hypothetical protein EOO74_01050 [Myxococcales bacterium]|nr:MAG: hypothetical protein EOO74_01050 [Myxococcales bacterium]